MDQIGIKKYIRTIKDFPHEGIMFRDVTSLFSDPNGLYWVMKSLSAYYCVHLCWLL